MKCSSVSSSRHLAMSSVWLLMVVCSAMVAGRRIRTPARVSGGVPLALDEDPDVPEDTSAPNAVALMRPAYIECQSSAECEEDHCCVLGGDRYSIPSCRPMQALEGACRPNGNQPFNTTVYYPDNSQVDLNVYWLFCPCAKGLTCHRESYSCQVY